MCLNIYILLQEYNTFKKFVDSIPTRNSKLGGQMAKLESYQQECDLSSQDDKRVKKYLL